MGRKRRLTKEEEKYWSKIYWSLIDKKVSHLEAHAIADKHIFGVVKT